MKEVNDLDEMAETLYLKGCRWDPPHWFIGWGGLTTKDKDWWREQARRASMDYQQAARIALDGARGDGMVRYVYRVAGPRPEDETWRVALTRPDRGVYATVLPQDRDIPEKPGQP